MPNLRRFLRTVCLCLMVALLVSGVVRATGEPQPGEPQPDVNVTIERAGQAIQSASARFHTFRMKSHYGQIDLDLAKVQTLLIESIEDDTIQVSVEMTDHTRMTGVMVTRDFPVTMGEVPENLKLEEGLKITFLHPKPVGFWAAIVGLLTLTIMEIVLGVDNVIFLAIVAGKLPEKEQPLARRIGLGAALGTRILLLLTLSWFMAATRPLFVLPELPFLTDPEARGVSIRDLVLFFGGLFLVGKSTLEIHKKVVDASDDTPNLAKKAASFAAVIVEIAIVDLVFSLDSVITAVGMVDQLWVMVVAMMFAAGVMVIFAEPISRFIDKNPSIKVLALSFLILIGVLLIAEGLGQHIDKAYIYFAMAFAVIIEFINMRLRPAPADPESVSI